MRDNQIWIGTRNINSDFWFIVPNGDKYEKIENALKLKHIMGCWFTNMDIPKRHEKLILWKNYTPEEYPKYDNYDAINVNKVNEIPCDYDDVMGVPITFLGDYNPEQFEILDARDYALFDKQKGKNTYLIKDADGAIRGKPCYARILIRKKENRNGNKA